MRLTADARQAIRRTAEEIFGAGAEVRLFGSRLDDQARGGDIDLLVIADAPVDSREQKVLRYVARLQLQLGDQPIDVLLLDPSTPPQPLHTQILQQGVRL